MTLVVSAITVWTASVCVAGTPIENEQLFPGCKADQRQQENQNAAQRVGTPGAPAAANWPLQLEMHVPFEPTAFPSGHYTYLIYELYLRNFSTTILDVRRIEVTDADALSGEPIAAFDGEELDALWQPLGAAPATNGHRDALQFGSGQSAIIFLCIALEHRTPVPKQLQHRVRTTDSAIDGAMIGTQHTHLLALGKPLFGSDWIASDGPSNDRENHHRRGVLIIDGSAMISRRYAIDWLQTKGGSNFSGDPLNKHSYYAYGKTVLAVADSRVVIAKDGLPENVPGHNEGFHPAVPITPETVAGNTISLDLGGGQFANYAHLQPGSLRVRTGDLVRRGQPLARIGISGDAREPHLHFQVSNAPGLFTGEGLPYLIDRYRVKRADGSTELHQGELPGKDRVIDFGQSLENRD